MSNKFPKNFEGSIKLIRLCNQSSVYAHSHSFLELVYVEGGSAQHNIGETSGELRQGDYFVVDYNTKHSYFSENEDLTIINCLFSPDILDTSFAGIESFNELVDRYFFRTTRRKIKGPTANQVFSDDGKIAFIIKKMLSEDEERKEGYVEMLRCMLIEIIINTVRQIGSESARSSITQQILTYIEKNYMNEFSLKKICEEMNYSLPYISAKFKKVVGISFTEYLQKVRIENSMRLLVNTNKTVESIANEVGYLDIKSFYKIFRKYTKTTPSKFRKGNNRFTTSYYGFNKRFMQEPQK